MTPLDAALPLTQRSDAAAVVRQNLDLDVPRPLEVLLDVDAAVAEGLQGLAPRGLERPLDVGVIADETHPLPAPAGDRFQHHGKAEALGLAPSLSGVTHRRRGAGDHRHSGSLHPATCLSLVAHRADRRRRWAHEDESRVLAGIGECGALRQEAIAGMDRLAARVLRCRDQFADVEIGLRGRSGTEQDGGVGIADMRGEAIRLGVDRDGPKTFVMARADHAHRDFAAVRDQHPLQRHPTSADNPNVSNALHNPPALLAARR